MIDQTKINKEWIDTIATSHKIVAKDLVEKVMFALLLLEGLVKHGVTFIFKGGTALMLHHGSTKRLSIDIDILMDPEPEDLTEVLQQVAKEQGFLRVQPIERKVASTITKTHYKFFYNSHLSNQEEPILLDILIEESKYNDIIEMEVNSPFVPQNGTPRMVKLPSKEDLLGDKLTAFAPNTTGIPYYRKEISMSMEIIKQLYDISTLFDEAHDLSIIISTFNKTARVQMNYRGLTDLSSDDVLNDIEETAICIVSRGKLGTGNYEELQQGISRLRNFIFSENYTIESAITSAAKAAYLAVCIDKQHTKLEKYKNPMQVKDWTIDNPDYNKLNKLKKSNTEAFFYVHSMLTLKSNEL